MTSLRLGDAAPDFAADTTEGPRPEPTPLSNTPG